MSDNNFNKEIQMRMKRIFGAAVIALAFSVHADVQVSNLFSDNLVFQRDMPVPVWGTAKPDEEVKVEFAGQVKTAKADAAGKWLVKLDPMKTSVEPATMVIKSSITQSPNLEIKNILVGDVWLCSGQSNMEYGYS